MFTGFLERSVGASAGSRKAKPCRKAAQRCHLDTLARKLDLGAQVSRALADKYGEETLQRVTLAFNDDLEDTAARNKFPYGFWKYFAEEELGLVASKRLLSHCARCFSLYVDRQVLGGDTRTSLRNGDDAKARRKKGCEQNATKARGLSWALLQFFIDEIQVLRSRADSTILLDRARADREVLIAEGWDPSDLPKLEGGAGYSWLYRWRLEWGIVMKATGMQLKVAWRMVKSRTYTFLTNLFRIRAFWALVHPFTPLRFLSADQKPSWFNNAGHVGTFGRKGEKAPSVGDFCQNPRTVHDSYCRPVVDKLRTR